MSRYAPVTDPDAQVNVGTTITQKMRANLQTLAFAKEHCTVKGLIALLIRNYLEGNHEFLQTLAGLREESPVSEQTTPANETVAVN